MNKNFLLQNVVRPIFSGSLAVFTKERGDHSEADKLEGNELLMIDDQLEQLEREMSPTYSTFREECEEDL